MMHVISEQKQNSALWSFQLSERDMLSPNYHTDEHIVTNCYKTFLHENESRESFSSWTVSRKVFLGNDT